MKEKYINDLKEIKDMMNKSSRFISLSGFSGVSAGILALIGAFIAHKLLFANHDYLNYNRIILTRESLFQLLLIASATMILAISGIIYFTTRETKKRNFKVWDYQTKRLLISLLIPLLTGGILCLKLISVGYIGIIAPLTLIFYGLALVNASKYTLNEVKSLGLLEIILGLVAIQFIGFGLIIWSFGFGILHIIYGLIIQRKYKL